MVEYTAENTSRTWYVIFDKRRGGFDFWHVFTRKRFDHVFLLTSLKNGTTLVLNPNPSECLIDEWNCSVEHAACYLNTEATAILKHESKYSAFKPYIPRGIINCVSYSKYLLGVGGRSFTPYGLYKQLIELGAQEYGK